MNNDILDDQFLKNSEVDFSKVNFSGKLAGKAWMLEQAVEKINHARLVLFIIGAFLIFPALFLSDKSRMGLDALFPLVVGSIFITFGLLVKKYPIPSILLPLVIYLSFLALSFASGGSYWARGLVWKLAIIFTLTYGLYSAVIAQRIKKELIIAARNIQ